jgi:glycosyltransferase involved in cell wall biosynthesis
VISVLAPSRGRPEQLARLHRSLVETTVGDWELLVRLDDDDPTIHDYPRGDRVDYVTGPRKTLSDCWNDCWRVARGPVFMQCADDVVFRTPGWDRIVADAFPADGIAFVHGDDLSVDGETGTHGFLRREWTDTVGAMTPSHFSSDWTDTWLREVADTLGRRVRVPIVTDHMHFACGKATLDLTYAERLVRHWKDRVDDTWAATAGERQQWVDGLRKAMA